MKRKLFWSLLVAASLTFASLSPALAMDTATYKKVANNTIKTVLSGSVSDVDALIADQKKLIAIGVKGCQEYAKKAPKHAKLMKLVIANADNMTNMTLDEIEPAWHDGEFVNENGIDFDAIDHFSPALSHMDAVLHPATAIIALRDYKSSGDSDLLEQVKDELSEVLKHIEHVN
ncbi:MAG: hypothetical protein IME99_07820 [Proteobacteria bacterium]|nr:hypothetical protein [Pseudomonadota bacterium]